MEAPDHAVGAQPAKPFEARRGRDSDGSCELLVRDPCIVLQSGEKLAIYSVQGRELALARRLFDWLGIRP